MKSKVISEGNRAIYKPGGFANTQTSPPNFVQRLLSLIPQKPADTFTSPEAVGIQGEKLLRKIAPTLLSDTISKEIVILVPTGEYRVDFDRWDALASLRKDHQEGEVYSVRLTAEMLQRTHSAVRSR